MTDERAIPTLAQFELLADALSLPSSFRERVGAGRDLRAGSTLIAERHESQAAMVRASLAVDEQREHHRDAPSPRRVPNAPRHV